MLVYSFPHGVDHFLTRRVTRWSWVFSASLARTGAGVCLVHWCRAVSLGVGSESQMEWLPGDRYTPPPTPDPESSGLGVPVREGFGAGFSAPLLEAQGRIVSHKHGLWGPDPGPCAEAAREKGGRSSRSASSARWAPTFRGHWTQPRSHRGPGTPDPRIHPGLQPSVHGLFTGSRSQPRPAGPGRPRVPSQTARCAGRGRARGSALRAGGAPSRTKLPAKLT